MVSHQGRGIFDVASGTLLARDASEAPEWFDPHIPAVLGIGACAGEWIPVAGLAGGRLAQSTAGGWVASQAATGVVLERDDHDRQEITETEEVRVFGFSKDGGTFVLGSSPTLRIFRLA